MGVASYGVNEVAFVDAPVGKSAVKHFAAFLDFHCLGVENETIF